MEMDSNHLQRVTLASVSNLNAYLAVEKNVETMYRNLTSRERLMGSLLNRTNSQRGLPPFDRIELLIKIRDFGPVLKTIPTWVLEECFTRAVQEHGRSDGPFQVSEVFQIWRDMSDTEKENLFNTIGPRALPRPDCAKCGNSGREPVEVEGQGPTSKKCSCGR